MTLNVFPIPGGGESPMSYIRSLANRNGYSSIEQFSLDWWGDRSISPSDISREDIERVIGRKPKHLDRLALLATARKSKQHIYKGIEIPKHQLQREEMYCPNCFSEQGYMLAKWQIGWLPMCVKHQRPLIPVCAVNSKRAFFGQSLPLPKDDCNHYDLFGHSDVCEIQQKLEDRLENEAQGIFYGNSVVEDIDKYLLTSLRLNSKKQLLSRRRRYALRHYPLKGVDSLKFLDCIASQALAA